MIFSFINEFKRFFHTLKFRRTTQYVVWTHNVLYIPVTLVKHVRKVRTEEKRRVKLRLDQDN